MTVRTRFAPSPTGYLHIGGVRTALFNWLFAKRHGGKFILRIDDTDDVRNRPEALQPILDGFRWLGILWDEGPEVGGPHAPYFQGQRNHLYRAAALQLLDSGHAYPCYQPKEVLDAERKEAEKAKQNYVHRGVHRDTPAAENRRLYDEKPTTLRLKITPGAVIAIDDQIRGRVEWQTDLMGDPVILRPDGRALYNFATVVDDAGLEITHVIRAAEHLTNTATQVAVYEALGAKTPIFAHIPVVNEPNSKKKLSKRDMKKFVTAEIRGMLRAIGWTDADIESRDDLNPATVAFYREMGYLPAGLVNYLARLGWSLDDKTEVMPLETMIANFSFERVNDAPASFDPEKLHWVAGEYMKQLPLAERIAGVIPILRRAKLIDDPVTPELQRKIERIVEACGERLKIFADVLPYSTFFFRAPEYDPAAVKKRLHKEGAKQTLREAGEFLKATPSFETADLERELKAWCEPKQLKIGDLNHILRVATTGIGVGPGLFECLSILGREETLARIVAAAKRHVLFLGFHHEKSSSRHRRRGRGFRHALPAPPRQRRRLRMSGRRSGETDVSPRPARLASRLGHHRRIAGVQAQGRHRVSRHQAPGVRRHRPFGRPGARVPSLRQGSDRAGAGDDADESADRLGVPRHRDPGDRGCHSRQEDHDGEEVPIRRRGRGRRVRR